MAVAERGTQPPARGAGLPGAGRGGAGGGARRRHVGTPPPPPSPHPAQAPEPRRRLSYATGFRLTEQAHPAAL